jgi:hypothetical protein
MPPGSFGRVKAWSDFPTVPITAAALVPLAGGNNMGDWGLIGVNEGSVTATVDEPGGIIAITTDTGDDDNHALVAMGWRPSAGGMECEFRLKIVDSVAVDRAAVFVGFTETLALDTPVMPAETDTTTTSYNGSGGMAGFVFDSAADVVRWRFVVGDGGSALATVGPTGTVGGAIGIDAEAGITADRWWVFRVEVTTAGIAVGYIGDDSGTSNANKTMREVGRATAVLGTSDTFHATALIENRSSANEIMEVDYAYANGWRDWASD